MTYLSKMCRTFLVGGLFLLLSSSPVDHTVAQSCVQAPDGLVSWWPGDGHTNDIINSNHGTLQNDATFAPGIVGQAFSFDGDGDFVMVPKAPNLDVGSQLTIDLWMRADPSNPLDECCQGLATTDFYELAIAPGAGTVTGAVLALFTTDGGFVHSSDTEPGGFPIPPGEWHHVAGVYDGSNIMMYVDGLLVAATPHTGDILPMLETSFLAIGSEDGRTNEPDLIGERYFHGLIDEVEIYDRALDAEEIQAIFNAGSAGKCKVTAVDIDIKPGSDPNSINCTDENEVIPVAILTTDDFDAMTVGHTTVTFGGASETHVDKKTGEPRRHEEDVDADGDIDLVFHFRLGDTALTCESIEGTLTGETFDGQAIEGSDAVRMVEGGGW